jgi:uncharacterized protein YegP (UPF0339 family)
MPNKKGSKGKQKFFWRAVSCNGNTICHAETYLNETSPRNTINSLIDAIKNGQYKIVEELVHE